MISLVGLDIWLLFPIEPAASAVSIRVESAQDEAKSDTSRLDDHDWGMLRPKAYKTGPFQYRPPRDCAVTLGVGASADQDIQDPQM
jgi:hypothetical protein